MTHRRHRRQVLWYLLMGGGLVFAGSALVHTGTAPTEPLQRTTPNGDQLEAVPPGSLPSFAQQRSLKVQEVYRYAVAHGETLQYIPCFCGCVKLGHRHNGDCYIAERLRDGRITFTNHGAT